jgi:hypothetical protein
VAGGTPVALRSTRWSNRLLLPLHHARHSFIAMGLCKAKLLNEAGRLGRSREHGCFLLLRRQLCCLHDPSTFSLGCIGTCQLSQQ